MKKAVLVAVVLSLLVALFPGSAPAAKRKKKGPKPYKSESVDVSFGHPVTLVAGAGLTRTAFEADCAVPETNGVDGYVFEVPKQYQKISATVSSFGSNGDYDIDLFVYDSDCSLTGEFGSEAEDEVGVMAAGSAYILAANYRPSAYTVHIELAPLRGARLVVVDD